MNRSDHSGSFSKSKHHSHPLLSRILSRFKSNDHNSAERRKSGGGIRIVSSKSSVKSSEDTLQDKEVPVAPAALEPEVVSDSGAPCLDVESLTNSERRYGGQCLTPDQLPYFCDQLRALLDVVQNVQAYAAVTQEYPRQLEQRLEREAQGLSVLLGEARQARDAVSRARARRAALRAHARDLRDSIRRLRDEEVKELELSARGADRKLVKAWEGLCDATRPQDFDELLDEVKNKQAALTSLSTLIEWRRSRVAQPPPSPATPPPASVPSPAPSPTCRPADEDALTGLGGRARSSGKRGVAASLKRRRRETAASRSVPVSLEPSRHAPEAPTPSPALALPLDPLTTPYELISQTGVPANMLPSLGSNSNHNLTLPSSNNGPIPTIVPFRFMARHLLSENSDSRSDQTSGDVIFIRIDDQGNSQDI